MRQLDVTVAADGLPGMLQANHLMPALLALGQHQALVAVQETLQPSERLLAFLDDVYVASVPARIATVEKSLG